MILKILKVDSGFVEKTNCYIVEDEKTNETMVVDPGGDVEKVMEVLEILNAKLKYIYLTHCHGDHIAGVKELKEKKGGKILIHRADSEGLYNVQVNLREHIGLTPQYLEADSRVDDNDLIHIGEIEFRVIHTPGHTIGGSSLYSENERLVFSGDTLFKGTWGRTDLPTGNIEDIMRSISNKLLILPDDTIVYPGHGAPTRIRDEEPIYYNLLPPEE